MLVKLSTLFDIEYGNSFELCYLDSYKTRVENSIPFISRSSKNNGITAFVKVIEDIEPFESGLITVAVGGSVLEAFLQNERFYTGYHILVLKPIKQMTVIEKLYYCNCIKANKYKYNYGRQANKTLKDIMIPGIVPEMYAKLDINDFEKPSSDPYYYERFRLDIDTWKPYQLGDLFTITGTKTTPVIELLEGGRGKYPYVTTRSSNNGVEGFYDYFTEDADVITCDSAVIGYCAYQPSKFSASDHVEKLIPRFSINKYIALFLVTILNLEQYRYNYGRKRCQKRIKETFIKLPAKNGNPDFEFMERYIKSLPYSSSV